ncbi:MAG: restriction endonuclease subunit S [Treponema succinifaciens]|uniref:restriction endonuclease subunit S n=1 Tax=Treponema succinifaciens TaxID=167 RepID=UPI0023572F67|nr:restriction endonuclease subunit S [Treponema succinifaciens]MCI6913792.1 restriction endonuclease subunit S [Treponema succinifaciens]
MNTKALRQKVLDLAIHGKLVPQNPNDESATVLLEKIRAEKAEKIKKGEVKADKKDSFIFVGSDKRHYEQFADGTVKDIEDEIPFEVPDGWAWCRFSDASINRDAERKPVNSTDRKLLERIYDYYGAAGIIDKIDNYLFDEKLLLIGEDGANLLSKSKNNAFIAEGKYWVNNHAHVIDCFDKSMLNYLCHFINAIDLDEYITGSAQPKFTQKALNELLIPLPPLGEQKRIVSKIENAFFIIQGIEENKSELTSAIKQAKSKILDLAIRGKLVPQDSNDEPAEELLKRIATSDNRPYEKVDTSELDWSLPNNWCLCHFGDIATVINGKNQSKVENPDGKYPIYGSGGIMGRADDFICPANCTIIGRKGSINNPIFVEEKFWNVDTAFGLCPSEAVLPKFLYYFCEYFDFTTLDSSTTLPSLTKTNIQQIVLALPPIDEQKRILDKTVELFGKLDEIVLNLV